MFLFSVFRIGCLEASTKSMAPFVKLYKNSKFREILGRNIATVSLTYPTNNCLVGKESVHQTLL